MTGGDRENPDVEFTSRVRADEITFFEAPETRVEFPGDTDDRSTSGSERTNLPKPVRETETYEDIQVDYRIEAYLRTEVDLPLGTEDDPGTDTEPDRATGGDDTC
ncbi:hypothetical protein [Saccharopolyspora rhizosphaerae]|uniref:hypothetical protein n=1 Tax=Saccharopolyspora rhizosphaerae TaxID=2492662 RepID=UPI0018F58A85|nr:hypothetical protein [Saccharopolyspora rhizosphaerae]